jgi:hypothetical protein
LYPSTSRALKEEKALIRHRSGSKNRAMGLSLGKLAELHRDAWLLRQVTGRCHGKCAHGSVRGGSLCHERGREVTGVGAGRSCRVSALFTTVCNSLVDQQSKSLLINNYCLWEWSLLCVRHDLPTVLKDDSMRPLGPGCTTRNVEK